jgi:hypothetical protein
LSRNAAALEDAVRAGDLPFIGEHSGAFRDAVEALTERIEAALDQARSASVHYPHGPNPGTTAESALDQLREALEGEDLEAIDAALRAAQALPLDSKRREEISRIAELILTADFKKAAEAVSAAMALNQMTQSLWEKGILR